GVNGSTSKSEGSFNLQFRIGNQRFRHRVYISSIINGPGLLGVDFLGKHQSRIHLDKVRLILDGTFELTLDQKLLDELGDIPEEMKPFLIDNEDIFALEGEPTGRSSIGKYTTKNSSSIPGVC
ncbi:unnamed protein product, partial [Hymenolepis diminuta]